MNLLIEELKALHMARDLERMIHRDDLLTMARSARCLLLASAGARLNAWAAPSHRQVRLELGRDSTPESVA